MKIIKHCVGIDVSKDNLECCIGSLTINDEQIYSRSREFTNSLNGFKELLKWVNKNKLSNDLLFVMEATGVYYEELAYWLKGLDKDLAVLLPNKVSHFAKSHNIKTKTDWVDAQILSKIGLERNLRRWYIPSPIMREIRFLTREYRELKFKVTASKNQLHAREHSHKCPASMIKRLKKQIKLLETQIIQVESELRVLIMSDSSLYDKIEKLETIPGVSFMTIICIIGETNAFALVTNAKQLVSYCGLDICHNQSGNRYGKTRISKKGNGFIRHALYMPALCATRHNSQLRKFYKRLVDKKPAKKIAVTAVARKLLILIYTLWKNEMEFDPNYSNKKLVN